MSRSRSKGGYTLVEMLAMLAVTAVVTTMALGVGRRAVVRHQLSSAVQTLATDLTRVKMRAIQTNSRATMRREAPRRYEAAGTYRELPGKIRFSSVSSDSVTFNGLGAVANGGSQRFVLVDPYGDSWEIRVFAGGGHAVQRL